MDTELPFRRAHPDAAEYARELLANPTSTYLDRSAIVALARVAFRDCPHANPAEWALLGLADTALELLHGVECF